MKATRKRVKKHLMNFKFSPRNRLILQKLAKVQNKDMTAIVERLVFEEGKRYGLLETRDDFVMPTNTKLKDK